MQPDFNRWTDPMTPVSAGGSRRPMPVHLRALMALALTLSLAGCTADSPLPGQGEDSGQVVVYRDSWGVPHIYAPTEEAGVWAMGWTQAEDRPEELLKNFLRGIGEVASVEGPAGIQSDMVARLWDNYDLCRRLADQVSPQGRRLTRAFVDGVNAYYQAHPEDLPDWWGDRQVDEAMVHAFGRLFLYSWSIDDGFGDLVRGGVQPNFVPTSRGSNQWAVSPKRSADQAAILLIDPHLGWHGASRFWEFRIHAGELRGSGFTLPGFPTIGLGHNEHLAWAMTTGGPDTADIFELQLKPGDPTRYHFDGEYRELKSRKFTLQVAGTGGQEITLYESHLGPIVARHGDRAWAHRTAYADVVAALDAWYILGLGRDYRAAVEALDTLYLFPQNIMVADTQGNIYYQRTGRVPIRPAGFDYSRPVDGTTSATDWQGFHPAADLVQLLNPDQGYMQNCNIPPDAMLVDSPLQPDRYRDYIFADRSHHAELSGWTNPRGARAVELLEGDSSVTLEEALAYAMDVRVYEARRWLELFSRARERFAGTETDGPLIDAAADLEGWDQNLTPDSTGALKYFLWKEQLEASGFPVDQARAISDLRASLGESVPLPELDESRLRQLWDAFVTALSKYQASGGDLQATYGDVFRVGRGDRSWPVGGGGRHGTSTLRNMNYEKRPDGSFWGRSGQTSPQVVVMSNPVRSWTVTPLGQSDRPTSPHYSDQAEQLFSRGLMKPTWWTPAELAAQPKQRVRLPYPGME